ncbi:MAG: hypothetical protein AAF611_02975 [Bacteroidota bacterium]
MKYKVISYIKANTLFFVVLSTILLFLAFDFTTKFSNVNSYKGFSRFSAIPKTLFEILLFVLLLKNFKKVKKHLWIVGALVLITALGLLISNDTITRELVTSKAYDLNKYLYSFFFAFAILSLDEKKQYSITKSIVNIFIIIGIINALCMLLGMFTDFETLRSYPYTKRFGYNGFFVKTSETSFMYILLIITTYYQYIQTKKLSIGLCCLFFMGISLLIGTKIVWLMIMLIVATHFLLHENKVIRIIAQTGIVLLLTSIFLFYQAIEKMIINAFSFGPYIYDNHGFMAVLTSKRNILLNETMQYLSENGSFYNYLIGGINTREHGVQFEIVDILLFFGFLGLIFFSILVYRVYFNTYAGKLKVALFVAFMLVVCFAGNFFTSIMCSIFAFVVFQHMKPTENQKL